MYAQLCKRLLEEAPNFEKPDKPCTFRLLLLNKCKDEFEKRSEINDQIDKYGATLEEEERRQLAKRKMLGNIKFIGELGKLEILSESILHRCIQALLPKSRKIKVQSEDFECLCQILRTCGRILDSEEGKKLMDQYFERMELIVENQELPPRIRFMLKDVIELRRDGWVPRKATTVEGPMPIHQIRPVEDDRISYRRDRNQDRDDRSNVSELFRNPMKVRGGFDDMILGISKGLGGLGSSSTNLIPTHNDKYNFTSNGYGNQRDGNFRGHNNQRSGYNNYNNSRGTYKHNQNNHGNNAQFNNRTESNKDLAPRFKNLIVAREQSLGDLELRPSANSMLFNKQSVKSANIMNSRPLDPPLPTPKPMITTSAPLLKESLPIKQASTEKPKQTKKDKGPNKEEILKKLSTLLDDYLKDSMDLNEALNSYRELKIPDKFAKDAALNVLTASLDKKDDEQEKCIKLLATLKKESLLNATVYLDTFKGLCNILEEKESESITNVAANLFSFAVVQQTMTLAEVATFTDNGAHYPLYLLVLQQLQKTQGENELAELFNASKVNLMSQLPESDRTKERLAEILEERSLTFLYPLLRIQAELAKQLQVDPNPQQFYKWIKENIDQSNYTDPGFINVLMTVLLKYISQESTDAGDDKAIAEKEKAILERYRKILQAFLQEKLALQLVAVYSLQVHCFMQRFPRGMLLRWFVALYDLEIIEEEAFLNWKEDVTDAYPGKGQALFQVNQWLTWLQEAEYEEDDDGAA